MADKLFNVGKLKSIFNKLFKGLTAILDGFDVKDGDVDIKEGQITQSIDLEPTEGFPYTLHIDLTAINVRDAFRDILNTINDLSINSFAFPKDRANIQLLTGEDVKYNQDTSKYEGDINIKAGKGLLGVEITNDTKYTDESAEAWADIMFNKMRYNLLCSASDLDEGSIDNQTLISCGKNIFKYIDYINSNAQGKETASKPKSHAEKFKSEAAATEFVWQLVLPMITALQAELRKRYQDKLNDELSIDKLRSEEADEENTDEPQNEETAQPTEEQQSAEGQPTESSKHISVTLQKVTASDDLAILSLSSNYLPGETLADIDEIINQEEFLNELTEEPKAFTIDVDDDGFDIEPCEECPQCNPCESLCEVFKAGIRAYRNLYILHWMSKGNDMMKLHTMAEEMYGELIQEIDTIGELLVEKQGTVPQLDFPCDYVPVQDYDFQTGLTQIQSLVQMYIDCIDYAYPNQTSDVQSTLDEWLRYWNKQLNYFLERQEV